MILNIINKIFLNFGYRILSLSELNYLKKNSKHKNYINFDETYCKYFNTNNELVIFDIGSDTGQSVERFRKIFPNSIIHCFEPSFESFKILKNSNYSNVILNNTGLSYKEHSAIFYEFINNNEISSFNKISNKSQFPPNLDTTNLIKSDKKMTSIDLYVEKTNLTNIDICKIDTQGFEVNVLKGATKTIKKNIIKFIEVEISASNLYENDFNFEIIFKILHENSFRLINLDKISYSREGKIYQFDLLFENKSLS